MHAPRLSIAAALLVGTFASIPAQAADWRTCTVGACTAGPCAADEGLIVVSYAIDVDSPAIGGAAGARAALVRYMRSVAGNALSGEPLTGCSDRQQSEEAAQASARRVFADMESRYKHGFVSLETPTTLFPGYSPSVAAVTPRSAVSPPNAAPAAQAAASNATQAGPGEPMRFIMWVDLRESINGTNSLCFHSEKVKPAPPGYRGQWPSLKNALPIIQSYFPLMLEKCRQKGTPVSDNVGFATDDIKPYEKQAAMRADVERWRKLGFPEVFISN